MMKEAEFYDIVDRVLWRSRSFAHAEDPQPRHLHKRHTPNVKRPQVIRAPPIQYRPANEPLSRALLKAPSFSHHTLAPLRFKT